MANLISGNSAKSLTNPLLWVGIVGLLLSLFGFFKVGSYAFSIIKDQSPIVSMAKSANIKLNAKSAASWFNEGVDALDNLINRRKAKEKPAEKNIEAETAEEIATQEGAAFEEYSGASYVFSFFAIFMLLKLVLSICTMIFRESLDLIR